MLLTGGLGIEKHPLSPNKFAHTVQAVYPFGLVPFLRALAQTVPQLLVPIYRGYMTIILGVA